MATEKKKGGLMIALGLPDKSRDESGGESEDGEGQSPREALAQEAIDAVKANDAKGFLDAITALQTAEE